VSAALARLLRVPLTVGLIWGILAVAIPFAMTLYPPYVVRPGLSCFASGPRILVNGVAVCRSLADLYHLSFGDLFVDSMFRSLALLGGAAVLALTLGTLLGVFGALLRRRAFASGAVIAVTALLTAVPAFFVAYFLQIAVIVVGAREGGNLLPVFGFGYDGHLVLPLLSVSIPAIAYTAQLTATRMIDVLDSDFMTTAAAKGLRTSWIIAIHVLPHVRPVLLEALGSGLRVSVASLPIVEFLFNWRGIGQLALEAVGVHDAGGFIFSAVAFAAVFTVLSAVADLSRPRAFYQPS
jgi:ABC-type dipeptide/oligopeptide/nickel transport system permease component